MKHTLSSGIGIGFHVSVSESLGNMTSSPRGMNTANRSQIRYLMYNVIKI